MKKVLLGLTILSTLAMADVSHFTGYDNDGFVYGRTETYGNTSHTQIYTDEGEVNVREETSGGATRTTITDEDGNETTIIKYNY